MTRVWPCLLLCLTACGAVFECEPLLGGDDCAANRGDAPDVWVDDVGEACVLADDDAVTVEVLLDDCVSSCIHSVDTGCRMDVVDGRIEVAAWGSYAYDSGDCDTMCRSLTATCEIDALAAGTYEITYAGEASSVTVGGQAACLGGD